MPNYTPNYGLPYPAPSDSPCDFDEQWCDFTDAISAVMDRFQTTVNRTVPVVPAAMLQLTQIRQIFSNQAIPFDAVTFDTSGMTDIDSDPTAITINRTGRYTIGGFIEEFGSGSVNNRVVATVYSSTNLLDAATETTILNRGTGVSYYLPPYTPITNLSAGDVLRMRLFVFPDLDRLVNEAWMGVFWHSDVETP